MQQTRTEEALRESRARLAAILEQLPVGVGLTDREGRVVMSNPKVRRGYGRELIERALPRQIDAETRFELREDGVHCSIDMPLRLRTGA